jgi:ABC-type uncharacterized transport system involved in gliding motility auxiliary subunit
MRAIAFKRFWTFSGSLLGVVIFLAILIAANCLLGVLHWRADLTEDQLYSLSDGTRHILAKLDAPVTLKFFFTEHSPNVPPPLKAFARQVRDLLKEYQLASDGKLVLETYDPQPDSDAEEWAERYGLNGQNLSLLGGDGAALYLGLVAVKGDVYSAIPFIDPRTEELLEYNISRLIARVGNPRKPAVGILSSLPVMGIQNFPYAMPGQPRPRNQPPWAAFQNLAEDYDVRQIAPEVSAIDTNLDVLVVVHPKNLSEQTQYALDQFVLRGGRLLAFLDPLCLVDATQSPMAMMGMSPPLPSSDLGRLTGAWGIAYEPGKVVADLEATTRVRQGEGGVDDSLVFLSLKEPNIDGRELITAKLESLILPCAGAFSGAGTESVKVASLLVSSAQSELINAMQAQMSSEGLRRDFKPGLKRLNLAVRLHGKFKTAFPEGKPKATPNPENPPEAKEPPSEEPAGASLKESAAPTTVILVADVDLLFDQFAVQELRFFNNRVFQPMNDNLNFFFNALEQLSGSSDLAQIRTRGRFERPFDVVQKLRREAEKHWLLQEKALQEKYDSTREQLEALQAKKDPTQRYIRSPEQEQAIKNFKQEQLNTQRELKEIRAKLRENVENLGVKVKIINIVAVPLLVILAGVAFWLFRRRRN